MTTVLVILLVLVLFGGGGWWYYHSGYRPYNRPYGPASQYGYDTTTQTQAPTQLPPRPLPNWYNPIGIILLVFVVLLVLAIFLHPWW